MNLWTDTNYIVSHQIPWGMTELADAPLKTHLKLLTRVFQLLQMLFHLFLFILSTWNKGANFKNLILSLFLLNFHPSRISLTILDVTHSVSNTFHTMHPVSNTFHIMHHNKFASNHEATIINILYRSLAYETPTSINRTPQILQWGWLSMLFFKWRKAFPLMLWEPNCSVTEVPFSYK